MLTHAVCKKFHLTRIAENSAFQAVWLCVTPRNSPQSIYNTRLTVGLYPYLWCQ